MKAAVNDRRLSLNSRRSSASRLAVSRVRRKRAGVSLIELVACISIIATTLVLVGTTFRLLFRAEKTVSQSFLTERSISQLAVQFRDDVHRSASGTINVDQAATKNELLLGDSETVHLRYAVTKDGLARLVVDGDSISAREDYRLPDCRIRFAAGPETGSQLRMLVIERPGTALTRNQQAAKPTQSLTIEAYLNRFQTLATDLTPTVPTEQANADGETKEDSQ